MSRRTAAVLLSVVVSAGALGACSSGSSPAASSGGASSSSSSPSTSKAVDAAAVISQASHSSSVLKSARITTTSVLQGKTTTISGQVGYHPTRLDLTVKTAGQELREILVANTFYIKLPPSAGSPKPWVSVSVKKISALAGIDLDSLLNNANADETVQLLTKSADVKYVGTESVGGVQARHLSGTVDIAKYLAALPSAEQGKQKNLQTMVDSLGVKNNKIDLWVNDKDIPLKVVQSYDSKLGPGTSTMLLTDLDGPVTVKAPPAAQVGQFPG
jgi:hypothetical protein